MVVFENPHRLEYGGYTIKRVSINGRNLSPETQSACAVITRDIIAGLPEQIEVTVGIS